MELIFEIVSYHRLSPDQTSKKSIENSITFGRSENNEWHLPDPEKVVSGVHAKVERKFEDFFIYDLSTNGLFINRAVEALGKNKSHKLMQDDLLTFGDYEVSVTLVEEDKNKLVDDPLHKTTVINQSKEALPLNEVQGINSAKLSGELLSFDTNKDELMPLVNNNLDDHFEAPQAIPEEWDEGILSLSTNNISHGSVSKLDIEPEIPQQIAQPSPSKIKQIDIEKPAVQKPIIKNITSSEQHAFLKGLGISQELTSDVVSEQLMYEMGECMNLMLLGLMESLRNRSNLKNEFRVNQTTFQQKENNPLKFSATIDDVFQNLFLRKSTSFLPATKAVTEAFNDTKKHDIALTAGTLGEIKGILNQLDPNSIESRDLNDSILDNFLPGHKQLKYWKLYKSLHSDITNEISNQGSSALSDDFVRAYDKKIKSL